MAPIKTFSSGKQIGMKSSRISEAKSRKNYLILGGTDLFPLRKGLGGCKKLKIYYNRKLKDRSRELRKNATFTERLLWKYLRSGQLNGYRFLRQKPIDELLELIMGCIEKIERKTSP